MSETVVISAPVAEIIPDAERMHFIPKLLPGVDLLIAEATLFNLMSQLCPAYKGAYWTYYRLPNGGYYMAPTGYGTMQIEWWGKRLLRRDVGRCRGNCRNPVRPVAPVLQSAGRPVGRQFRETPRLFLHPSRGQFDFSGDRLSPEM